MVGTAFSNDLMRSGCLRVCARLTFVNIHLGHQLCLVVYPQCFRAMKVYRSWSVRACLRFWYFLGSSRWQPFVRHRASWVISWYEQNHESGDLR